MTANEWTEWMEQHRDDPPQLPERIRVMHAMNGTRPEHLCKDCKFLVRITYAKTYIKCSKSSMTHGPGTDWRVNWTACGLFEEGEQKTYAGPK